ncbi:MAG TPA: carboxypeptidase regulatory-like domain-containing protein [Candidatus Acidoferrales bacterium]|nr:carboxypeptidase regulatory-like domain-containing protein [Candidatus Acidoferrales bacterium]
MLPSARLLAICSLVIWTGTPLAGQGFGKIVGAAIDPQGLGVPNARVVVTEAATGLESSTVTNQEGFYTLPALRPTQYNLTVTAGGFKTFTQSGITLRADETVTVNASLQLGAAAEKVTVSADAPQVDTATGTLGQVVDTKRVEDLPLNGRNAAQLTVLVAGVVAAPNDSADQGQTKTFPVVVTISANGSRANTTNYMLDGGNNVDEYTNVNLPFPFPDALQEFSVQTSNYSAEYGLNAGGLVNVVTKSGTNELHGDAFEYLRNREFNARNFFAKVADPLKRNQFGVTAGAPVYIPKVYNGRDKTFFFFGYQGTILRNMAGAQSAFVPTAAQAQGIFSSTIYDPKTSPLAPFPNNTIPTNRLDPASAAFMKDLPVGVGNGLVFYQKPVRQNFNEEVVRVDHQLTTKDRLTGRYYRNRFYNVGILDTTNLLTFTDEAKNLVQNGLLSETHTFSPSLINVFTLNYARVAAQRGAPPGSPSVADFGVNIWQPPDKALQQIQVSGFFTIGDNPKARFTRNNWSLRDDVHWNKGNHTLAFGVGAEISRMDIDSQYQEPGAFNFTADTTGNAIASFDLGYLRTLTQGSGQFFNNRNQFLGLYASDSYRVNRRLTVNAGVRWEPFFPWKELKHRITQFNPTAYYAGQVSSVYTNAPPGLRFPGDSGMPENGVNSNYNNFMPRVGFAWDATGDGKTSVRGGSGIFYDTRMMAGFMNAVTTNTPFSPTVSITTPQGPFSDPYRGIVNPFPTPVPIPKNVAFPLPVIVVSLDPSGTYKVPAIYNWNLTVERQVAKDLMAHVSYVGSHTSHLATSLQLNPAVYTPGSTLSTDARRIFQSFSGITLDSQAVNGHYNSLQAGLEKRLSRGVTILANYTWAKAMDNLPFNQSVTGPGPNASGTVYPWYFPKADALDYGRADFDRTHRFVISYVWVLPTPKGANKAVRILAGGWQMTGLFQAQTGLPLTVTAGQDRSQTGLGVDRAVVVGPALGPGACGASAPCVNYLIPGSFQLPPTAATAVPYAASFGNFGKGAVSGPGAATWDVGAFKNFVIHERASIQFRAEFFNVLNRANFNNPTTTISSGGFGSITGAGDPRIGQLALKFVW